jgi:hypothetical protein
MAIFTKRSGRPSFSLTLLGCKEVDGDQATIDATSQFLDINGNVLANTCANGTGTRFEDSARRGLTVYFRRETYGSEKRDAIHAASRFVNFCRTAGGLASRSETHSCDFEVDAEPLECQIAPARWPLCLKRIAYSQKEYFKPQEDSSVAAVGGCFLEEAARLTDARFRNSVVARVREIEEVSTITPALPSVTAIRCGGAHGARYPSVAAIRYRNAGSNSRKTILNVLGTFFAILDYARKCDMRVPA